MIIRVVEGRVVHGFEAVFTEAARATLKMRRETTPGFHHGHFGRRLVDDETEFVWVTEWDTRVSLTAVVGGLDSPPTFIRNNPTLVASWTVRTFEGIDEWSET